MGTRASSTATLTRLDAGLRAFNDAWLSPPVPGVVDLLTITGRGLAVVGWDASSGDHEEMTGQRWDDLRKQLARPKGFEPLTF